MELVNYNGMPNRAFGLPVIFLNAFFEARRNLLCRVYIMKFHQASRMHHSHLLKGHELQSSDPSQAHVPVILFNQISQATWIA